MSESVNAPDLGGIISQLLANPTALSGMMNLIGNMRTEQGEENKVKETVSATSQEKNEEESVLANTGIPNLDLASLAPLLSGANALIPLKKGDKSESAPFPIDPMKRRRCLLEAIRPYLSPARCEHLDLLLRILDVLSLLSQKK